MEYCFIFVNRFTYSLHHISKAEELVTKMYKMSKWPYFLIPVEIK